MHNGIKKKNSTSKEIHLVGMAAAWGTQGKGKDYDN